MNVSGLLIRIEILSLKSQFKLRIQFLYLWIYLIKLCELVFIQQKTFKTRNFCFIKNVDVISNQPKLLECHIRFTRLPLKGF